MTELILSAGVVASTLVYSEYCPTLWTHHSVVTLLRLAESGCWTEAVVMADLSFVGVGEISQQLRVQTAFAKDEVWFLAPVSSNSQLPVTSVPR